MSDPAFGSTQVLDLLPAVFPWVRFLTEADRMQLAQELVDLMNAPAMLHRYPPGLTAIDQWRHTAEIYADSELLPALRADLVDAGPVPVPSA